MPTMSGRLSSLIGRRPRYDVAAFTVALGLTIGVAVTAVAVELATASTVYYACVNPTTKVMTLSTKAARCPGGGTKIHWNQAEPQGPTGVSHGYAADLGNAVPLESVDGPRLPVVTPPGKYIVVVEVYDGNGAATSCQIQDTDKSVASNDCPVNAQQPTVVTSSLTIPLTASSTDTVILRCGVNVTGSVIAVAVDALN